MWLACLLNVMNKNPFLQNLKSLHLTILTAVGFIKKYATMSENTTHAWEVTPAEAIAIQTQLRTQIQLLPLQKKSNW